MFHVLTNFVHSLTILMNLIFNKMSNLLQFQVFSIAAYINSAFAGKQPWQISAITASSVIVAIWIRNLLFQPDSLYERGKSEVFRILKKIPYVSKKVDEECDKIYKLFEEEVMGRSENTPYIVTLPDLRLNSDNILNLVKSYLSLGKYKWEEGYVSGAIYYYDENLINLITEVCGLSSYTNPLHPDVFPGICKMEAEIIRIVANLFHGTENTCGTMTSGGTESIMMACKAYRDYGKSVNGIKHPEMIVPRTAHPAFDKAGSYFGIRLRHIDVHVDSKCVNIKSMEHAINKNTIMLAGSAPNFPYGTIDDIEAIAKLGQKYNIPVHVDCCLGSFVIAFMSDLGYKVPPFDFDLPGITSISVDTHKYGFAPKGSSVILYSDRKFRHHQYYASLSWPGGLYGSPSVSGSRSGAIIAACWATIMYFGRNGYLENIKQILSVAEYIEGGLRHIPGIFVFGKPFSTVIAIGSNTFHIYRLSDALNNKWNLNMLQFPFGIHICVTQLHTLPGTADKFLNDVKKEVDKILQNPNKNLEGKLAMYGMSTMVPDRTLVGDFTKCYLDAHYYTPKTGNQ